MSLGRNLLSLDETLEPAVRPLSTLAKIGKLKIRQTRADVGTPRWGLSCWLAGSLSPSGLMTPDAAVHRCIVLVRWHELQSNWLLDGRHMMEVGTVGGQ